MCRRQTIIVDTAVNPPCDVTDDEDDVILSDDDVDDSAVAANYVTYYVSTSQILPSQSRTPLTIDIKVVVMFRLIIIIIIIINSRWGLWKKRLRHICPSWVTGSRHCLEIVARSVFFVSTRFYSCAAI